jgi:hypothetical protein
MVVRVALGRRRIDLSLDQAGRLAGELTAAVRLAQHHAAGEDAAGPSRLRPLAMTSMRPVNNREGERRSAWDHSTDVRIRRIGG